MIAKHDLQVFLVSDTLGKDDEGMKKIARMLAKSFQTMSGINVQVLSIHEVIRSIHQALASVDLLMSEYPRRALGDSKLVGLV